MESQSTSQPIELIADIKTEPNSEQVQSRTPTLEEQQQHNKHQQEQQQQQQHLQQHLQQQLQHELQQQQQRKENGLNVPRLRHDLIDQQSVPIVRTQQKRIITTSGTLREVNDPGRENDTDSDYANHQQSPSDYVAMTPRSEEPTTVYTYEANPNTTNLITSENPLIKIESLDKDQKPQQLQQQQSAEQPSNNTTTTVFTETTVVPASALSNQHNQHTQHHTTLRAYDDEHYTTTITTNNDQTPIIYYDPGASNSTTIVDAHNEGKTFTNLGSAAGGLPGGGTEYSVSNNYTQNSPYAGLPAYNMPNTNPLLYKTDPSLNSIRSNSQFPLTVYESPNGTESYWPSTTIEFPNINYNQVITEDYGSPGSSTWVTSSGGTATSSNFDGTGGMELKCQYCGSQLYRKDNENDYICLSCPPTRMMHVTRLPPRQTKPKASTANNTRRAGVSCANCFTTSTTLWRRNNESQPVCNACGLYYKLHNMNRPLTMKKEGIQKRKRKPKLVNGVQMKNTLPSINVPNHHMMYPSQVQNLGLPMVTSHELHDISNTSAHTVNRITINAPDVIRHHITSEVPTSVGENHSAQYNCCDPPSQSQSPHLPHSSTLSRQINQTVPPIDGGRSVNGEIATSVITSTGIPERSSNN